MADFFEFKSLLEVVQKDLIDLNKFLGYHKGEDRYLYLIDCENGWFELRSNTKYYFFGNIGKINAAVKSIFAFVEDTKEHKDEYPF